MVIQPSDVHIAEYPALLVAILIIRTPVVDPPSEQSVNEVKGFRHKANFFRSANLSLPIFHSSNQDYANFESKFVSVSSENGGTRCKHRYIYLRFKLLCPEAIQRIKRFFFLLSC